MKKDVSLVEEVEEPLHRGHVRTLGSARKRPASHILDSLEVSNEVDQVLFSNRSDVVDTIHN